MGHLHRFYIAPETYNDGEITLSAEEAHHALHVVRVRESDPVELFDGRGRILAGMVRIRSKHDIAVKVDHERREPLPAKSLTLIQAWPNHDKTVDAIIRDCTAVGVTAFCFFRARHSEHAPRRSERWEQAAIESCKQCGRAWLPTFTDAQNLQEALAGSYDTLFIATKDLAPVPLNKTLSGDRIALLVGPEGDFSEDELEVARQHKAKALSLGTVTFRSEVAAIVASTLILDELGALSPRA